MMPEWMTAKAAREQEDRQRNRLDESMKTALFQRAAWAFEDRDRRRTKPVTKSVNAGTERWGNVVVHQALVKPGVRP
jgi:hypothetical protein